MASAPSLLSPGRVTQAFATASGAGSPAPSSGARSYDAAAGGPATGRPGLVAGLGSRPMSAAVQSPSRTAQLATAQAVVPHAGSLWSSGPAAGANSSATGVAGSASASSLGSLGAQQQQRRVTLLTNPTGNSGRTGANSAGQLSFQPPLPHSMDPANTGSPNSAGLDPPSRPWSLAGESSAGVRPRSAMTSHGGGTGGPGGGRPPRPGSMAGNIPLPMSPARHDRMSRNGGNGLASARASRNGSIGVGPGTGTGAGAAAGGDGSGRGTPTSGAAGAPGVSGGIDLGRLIAIQKLLDEWDSDEEQPPGSARGGAASGHRGSEAYGRSSDLGYRGERRTSDSSGIGLRSLTSLRDRGDMHLWQPSVSVATGSVADHQQRLKERTDVTQSLRRWADQVLTEAHRPDGSQRLKSITAAASTHQVDDADQAEPDDEDDGGGGGGGGGGRGGRASSKPDPSGVGAQLRAHFLAAVAEEVNKKFEMMRTNWEEEVAVEMEELRELREAHKDLRRQHTETKEALDKANTRLELMKSQVKSVTMNPDASVLSAPPNSSSPHAVRRSVTMHPHQHPLPHSVPLPHVHDPSDPLHDRLHNIGSRRNTNTSFGGEAPAPSGGRTSPLNSRGGAAGGQGSKGVGGLYGGIPHDVQAQLRHQEEKAAEMSRKLQAAELQIITLKQQNTKLEHDLHTATTKTAAAAAASPPTKGGGGTGAKGGSKPPAGGRGAKGGRPGSAFKDTGGSGAGAREAAGEAKALQGQVEGLGRELAAAREAAAARQQEVVAKEQEAAKLQQELTGAQHTLSAALQQLAALRDELAAAQQQGREHQLAAAEAEAAEAAAQQQSEGRGEEVGRLVEERDAAVRLAEELHQEVEALRAELRAVCNSASAGVDAGAGGPDSAAPSQPPPPSPPPPQQQQQLPAEGEHSLDSEPSRADNSVSEQQSHEGQDRDGQVIRGRVATTEDGVQTSPRPGYGYAHGDSFGRAWASTAPRESHGVQTSAQPTPRQPSEQQGTGEGPRGAAGGAGDGGGWVEAVEARLQERLPRVVAEAAVAMAEEHMEGAAGPGAEGGAGAGPGAGGRLGAVLEEGAGGEGSGEGGDGVARIAAAVERMVREQLLGLLPRAMAIFLDTHAPGMLPQHAVHAVHHSTADGLPYQQSGPAATGAAADTGSGGVPSLDLTRLPHSQLQQQQGLGSARPSQGSFMIAGTALSGPRESQVGAQVQQLATGASDARLYVFRPASGSARRQGQGQLPVGYATSAGAAAAAAVRSMSMSPRGARSLGRGAVAGGGERDEGAGAVPRAVTVEGVMFTPLLTRGGSRSTWQEQAALMEQQAHPTIHLPGGHGPTDLTHTAPAHHLPASHHAQQPQHAQHGHVSASMPEKERGGMDTMVSVSLPNGRHNLVSVATARRRASAFAALHSTYLAPVRDGSPPRDADAGAGQGEADGWESEGQGEDGAVEGERGWDGRTGGAAGSGTASARALRLAAEGAVGGAGGLHGEAGGRSGSPPDAAARMQQQQQQGLVLRRPQSAAARAYESLRQQQQVVSEQGQARPRRPATAAVITGALRSAGMAGAPTFAAAAAAGQQQGLVLEGPRGGSPARDGGQGGSERREGSPPRAAGARVRPLTANPQKGVQLPAHLRALRHTGWSAGAAAGTAWAEADALSPAAAITATVLPGTGISPPFTEIQLHTGRDAAAVAAASRDRTEVHWSDTGGAVQLPYALPSAAPPAVPPLLLGHAQAPLTEEGAVDAAAAAAAVQQAAERELAEAEEVRRELAEEVAASRQQWLDEARRARALEAELQSLRQLLQGAAPRY